MNNIGPKTLQFKKYKNYLMLCRLHFTQAPEVYCMIVLFQRFERE